MAFGLDDILNILSVVAALTSAGTTVASAVQGPPGAGMKVPTPEAPDAAATARAQLPTQKANTAAMLGGGVSPEFLANLLSTPSLPGAGLDILGEIQRSLGQGQGVSGVA